jgi:hypothetical protein
MEAPKIEYRVVRKDHFDWIHRESLRLGNMARDYHQQSVELLAEVVRLKTELELLTNNNEITPPTDGS